MKSHGQIAFEAYSKQVGGKTYDDKKIPSWVALTDEVRAGWNVAAQAVLDQKHEDQNS